MATPDSICESIAWIHHSPTTLACRPPTSSAAGIFRGRRRHKKSRLGCRNCKRRRVKCDESRPMCNNCSQQRIECEYLSISTLPNVMSVSLPESPWSSAATATMTSEIVETQLRNVIRSSELAASAASGTSRTRFTGASLIGVLHHFEHVASGTIGTTSIQQTMRTIILSLAQDSPFLINAMLAFSANHLHILKSEDHSSRLTAEHHSQIALHSYSQTLAGELKLSEINSTVAACLLVTAIAFFTENCSPSASFLFSDDPKQAEWLTLVAGLAGLLRRAENKDVISKSIWMPMISGNTHQALAQPSSSRTSLPEAFLKLCHVDDESTADNNPYHSELDLLDQLMAVRTNNETFANLVQFPCRMDPAFVVLIQAKDPVALLILAYWFTNILEVDFWWLKARARSELFAICSYLDGWPDDRFERLLQYPMQACAYVPIDTDMIEACVFGM
jgi:hypothetical protein